MFHGFPPTLRRGLTSAVAAGFMLTGAGTAAAHVSVSAPNATPGRSTVATFSVPTESDTAATTALRITVPEIATARTEPIPGWTAKIERNDEDRVVALTWTANPGSPGIRPGEFQRFVVSLGPLPETDSIGFPAEQSYSDGTVVRWDDTGDHDSAEHPAPVLTLGAETGDGSGHEHGDQAAAESDANTDTTARWLGGLGLALAALALGAGIGAVVRGRR
ncbi:YcnI family protein [Nocardia flavorosea]|uniref:YcnI family copper-binding membrane protein n=1 Tax=Nocardia flavorosea TaxID=53429 RepID=UPI0018949170|nr:YcnI family protein [Nocardia flavorosea]MBF6350064.1 YcnI family protein [Nocardia flavorosea]